MSKSFVFFQWQLSCPSTSTGDVAGRQLRWLGAVGRRRIKQRLREEETTSRRLDRLQQCTGAVAAKTRLPHIRQTYFRPVGK